MENQPSQQNQGASAPVPQPQPSYSPQPGYPVAPQPQKKSLLWLWITLGAVALVIIGAVITLLVGLNGANSAAKNYNAANKTYLEDVADAISGSASDPEDIADDVKGIQQPALKKAFLGSWSDSYKKAENSASKTKELVDSALAEIALYADFKDYYTDLGVARVAVGAAERSLIAAEPISVSAMSTAINRFESACDAQLKITKDAKVPEGAKKSAEAMHDQTDTLCGYVAEMKDAIDAGSKDSYVASAQKYNATATPYNNAFSDLKADYEDSASQVKDLAKPLQEQADAL